MLQKGREKVHCLALPELCLMRVEVREGVGCSPLIRVPESIKELPSYLAALLFQALSPRILLPYSLLPWREELLPSVVATTYRRKALSWSPTFHSLEPPEKEPCCYFEVLL